MESKTKNQNERIALVRAYDLPISTRHSIAVCRFLKNRSPDKAIELLSRVIKKKVAVPITGEIPHRKGMMSGRYPEKVSKYLIKMIKNVIANANVKGMNTNNLVLNAIPNKGSTTYHSGRHRGRFKRTHITLIARERIK